MSGFTETQVTDQSGKTAFVTGANSGIGFHVARVLATKHARVLMGCRSEERARQAKAADLQPQLDQLDQLDGQVGELEAAVEQLDAYSRRLETKFDALAARKDGET